jgi:hypothetical protein
LQAHLRADRSDRSACSPGGQQIADRPLRRGVVPDRIAQFAPLWIAVALPMMKAAEGSGDDLRSLLAFP